jgi:hypothetical protein
MDLSLRAIQCLVGMVQVHSFNHHAQQSPTHPEPTPTRAAEPTTEIPIAISRARNEVPAHTDAEHNLSDGLNRATSNGNAYEVTLDDDREAKQIAIN